MRLVLEEVIMSDRHMLHGQMYSFLQHLSIRHKIRKKIKQLDLGLFFLLTKWINQ